MSRQIAELQEATLKAQCKVLRMPMMASQFASLAEQAIREKTSHAGYLEGLLAAEIEERERNTIERRIRSTSATDENAGRVRLHAITECHGCEKCATWPRAATSNVPRRCCSSANA
jgi:DNA replication protein DnaC